VLADLVQQAPNKNKPIYKLTLKNKNMILEAYCLKTKKNEVMVDPIIYMTAKGGYMAKGASKDGHKMAKIMNKATAEAAVAAGVKKEGW